MSTVKKKQNSKTTNIINIIIIAITIHRTESFYLSKIIVSNHEKINVPIC